MASTARMVLRRLQHRAVGCSMLRHLTTCTSAHRNDLNPVLETRASRAHGCSAHPGGLADAVAGACAAKPAKLCGLLFHHDANGWGLATCGPPGGSGAGRRMMRRDPLAMAPKKPVTERSAASRKSSTHPWPAASSTRAWTAHCALNGSHAVPTA